LWGASGKILQRLDTPELRPPGTAGDFLATKGNLRRNNSKLKDWDSASFPCYMGLTALTPYQQETSTPN
jgi:hypothetical protein